MLVLEPRFADPLAGKDIWWGCLVNTFPDLFFVTIYTLLILFCAQLYYVAIDWPYDKLKTGFAFANVGIWLAYGAVAVYSVEKAKYSLFWTATEYGVGVLFCLGILAAAYYGWRVREHLQPRTVSESQPITLDHDSNKDVQFRRLIVRRVTILCSVCIFVFAIKAAAALALATRLVKSEEGLPFRFGSSSYLLPRKEYDVIVFAVVELLPSLLVLWITHRRGYSPVGAKDSDMSSGGQTLSSSRHSVEDDVDAWEPHMQDAFAHAQQYPQVAPHFPGYGSGHESSSSDIHIPREGSAGLSTSLHSGTGSYYSTASFPAGGDTSLGHTHVQDDAFSRSYQG